MKQIFLDYTRKYNRGGGTKTTMSPKCECCAESQSERTKLIGGQRSHKITLSLCHRCARMEDEEIWKHMTHKLMRRILASQNGK